MDLIGQEISLVWFTTNDAGAAANTDTPPTVTLTGPAGVVTATVVNESVGQYRTKFTPTLAGRWVAKLTGTIAGAAQVAVQYRTVHDGVAQGQGLVFPDGLASWDSVVV